MRKGSGNHGRVPEAASIVTQHSVMPSEGVELGVPHPPIGNPCVHEHNRIALSGNLIVESGAANLGVTALFHPALPSHSYR